MDFVLQGRTVCRDPPHGNWKFYKLLIKPGRSQVCWSGHGMIIHRQAGIELPISSQCQIPKVNVIFQKGCSILYPLFFVIRSKLDLLEPEVPLKENII